MGRRQRRADRRGRIIALTFAITGATAVSLASISTNFTPGAGGAYALVARSFGVGWLAIFPDHPPRSSIWSAAWFSSPSPVAAEAAFPVQNLILAVVAVALGAVAVAAFTQPLDQAPEPIGAFPGSSEEGFVDI